MKRGAPDNSSNYSNDDNSNDDSNDNLPNQKLRILDNETQGMINFLPQELIGRILNLLNIATLMNASQVNKTWHGLIRQMAKDWISIYFPYLSTTQPQACQDTPLKCFSKECKKYRNILKEYDKKTITLELVLDALRGSKEVIDAANLNKDSKTYLYALLISNNHHLPKDFSSAEEITLDDINNKALEIAAQNGNLEVVKRLLTEGNISDKDKGVGLMNAAKNGHLDVAERLLKEDGISGNDKGQALINNAASSGYLEVTRLLLAAGNISDFHKGWALIYAAQNGHLDATKFHLAEEGNISDDDKGWALIYAARNGHLAIAEALLKSGGISSDDKGKALTFAIGHNHTTIAEAVAENIALPSLLPNELAPTTPAIIQAAPTYTPLQMMGNGIDNAQPNNDPASTNTTEERASNASSLSHS